MVFQLFPSNQKDVAIVLFDTALKLVPTLTLHSRNDWRGLFESRLKLAFKTRFNIQNDDFENHIGAQRISIESNANSMDSMRTPPSIAFKGEYDRLTGHARRKYQVKTTVE